MTGKKRATQTDWQKVDAYVLGPKDYEEIPELTDEDFARGVLHIGGVPVPRGRPKSARPKQPVSLRLDADVIAHFRRGGRGWQSRINEIVLGKRAITADTDLRLARYFGMSEGFFIGLQTDYELMQRRRVIGAKLKAIRPRAA